MIEDGIINSSQKLLFNRILTRIFWSWSSFHFESFFCYFCFHQWQALMNMVTSWVTISFSRRTLLHGVSYFCFQTFWFQKTFSINLIPTMCDTVIVLQVLTCSRSCLSPSCELNTCQDSHFFLGFFTEPVKSSMRFISYNEGVISFSTMGIITSVHFESISQPSTQPQLRDQVTIDVPGKPSGSHAYELYTLVTA